jgi:hypothetical protein
LCFLRRFFIGRCLCWFLLEVGDGLKHPNGGRATLLHSEDVPMYKAKGSRVKAMGGNYMTDNIGENYDLILASQTLGFAGNELDNLLKKLYSSLNAGGVLITMHEGLTLEKTKPSSIVLATVGTALRGSKELRFFEAGETAEAMRRAGFKSIYRFPVELDCGEEEITIARK